MKLLWFWTFCAPCACLCPYVAFPYAYHVCAWTYACDQTHLMTHFHFLSPHDAVFCQISNFFQNRRMLGLNGVFWLMVLLEVPIISMLDSKFILLTFIASNSKSKTYLKRIKIVPVISKSRFRHDFSGDSGYLQ